MSHVGLDFIAAQISHGKKYEQHLKHNLQHLPVSTSAFNFPVL